MKTAIEIKSAPEIKVELAITPPPTLIPIFEMKYADGRVEPLTIG
jgi:hypothetical protein